MRYLSVIIKSMPIFVIAAIWGVTTSPMRLSIPALGFSTLLGFTLGRYMSRALWRHLMLGDALPLNRFPGGIWFIVAVGILGGLLPLPLFAVFGSSVGWLVVRIAAIAFGAVGATVFITIAVSVWQIERAEGRQVIMGHGGFFFESEAE